MRVSELFEMTVTDADGMPLGKVIDVRVIQNGRLLGAKNALQVEGLIVGRHKVAARLGYDRYEQHGPPLVRWLVGRLVRHNRFLPWSDVTLQDGGIKANGPLQQIPQL